MRTLGIDLAAEPRNTAACVIDWTTRETWVRLGIRNDEAVELLRRADHSAIDAPFGWPEAFRAAINDWSERGVWTQSHRPTLRLRETDCTTRLRGAPLSVSADRIASVAFRCALLLADWSDGEPLDRVNGRVVEAYPAAALRAWNVYSKGYRTSRDLRVTTLASLSGGVGFALPDDVVETDHALDALICALVARAAALRKTDADRQPSEKIRREGWIHVPTVALEALR